MPPAKKVDDEDFQSEAASKLTAGQRCEINPGGKRGQIRYQLFVNVNVRLGSSAAIRIHLSARNMIRASRTY